MVDDDAVVQAAVEAAENVVLSRYRRSEIDDFDLTVTFEDRVLEVDVYLNGPGDDERIAEDAALAARGAVDRLIDEE